MRTNILVITNLFFPCQYQENDSVFLINNSVTSNNYIKIMFHHRISFEISYVCFQNIFFWISFYPKIILCMASLYMSLNQSPENEWQWGLVATLPHPNNALDLFLSSLFFFRNLLGCLALHQPTHPVCAVLGLGDTQPHLCPGFPQPLIHCYAQPNLDLMVS